MSEKHVEQLIEKAAAKTTNSIEAMQFSQAAVNAAMALNNLKMFRMAENPPCSTQTRLNI
jgi:hypothetical protein